MNHIVFLTVLSTAISAMAVPPDIQKRLQEAYPSSIIVPESWLCDRDSTNVQTFVSADLDGKSVRDYVVTLGTFENGELRVFLVAVHNLHTKDEGVFVICDLHTDAEAVATGLSVRVCPGFEVLPPGEHQVTRCAQEAPTVITETFETAVLSLFDCGRPSYVFDGEKYVKRSLGCCNP